MLKKTKIKKDFFNVKINLLNDKQINYENVYVEIKEFKKPIFDFKKNYIFTSSVAIIYMIDEKREIKDAFLSTNNLLISDEKEIEINGIEKFYLLKKEINTSTKQKMQKAKKNLKLLESKLTLGLDGEEIIMFNFWEKEFQINYLLFKNNWAISN